LNVLLQTLVFPGLLFLLSTALLYEWFDRKIVGRFQSRYGPSRTGPGGILQPLADLIKLLSKEDIVPTAAGRLFAAAPILILTLSVMPLFYVPVAGSTAIASFEGDLIVVLFLATLRVALILLSGTSSGSKFAEVGGTRAGLQMLGYSVPLTLAAIGPAISSSSLSLSSICRAQSSGWWYILTQPLGFAIFSACALAELGRLPFDLSLAESEIVAGWKVEYSGKSLALLRLAEDFDLIFFGNLMATLFFGGANPLWLVPPVVSFFLKFTLCIGLLSLLRAAFARYEVGQMIRDLWKYLVPLSLLQVALIIL
jgi:NADH-quinone oxidoreductase subunit H